MVRSVFRVVILTVLFGLFLIGPGGAVEAEKTFLSRLDGHWKGGGRFDLGPEYNFSFKCHILGDVKKRGLSVDLNGSCWRGILSTAMGARLFYSYKTGQYEGEFTDVTKTVQIAIKDGKRKGNDLSLGLAQGTARGHMSVKFFNKDEVSLVISVISQRTKRKVPVISVTLARIGNASPAVAIR